ncbi:MAG: PIN domain nuclease [Thermosynechococcaceae cyanobacterium]
MLLIDTSVWINVFRDRSGDTRHHLETLIAEQDVVLSRFTQLELLQGCRDQREWELLQSYLAGQDYLDLNSEAWVSAARIYYDLRRQGLTVRSPIDCCIAQIALDCKVTLVHCDRDFETITQVRPLQQHFFKTNL